MAQAGNSRVCSGPTTNQAACGTTRPTTLIVPTIETIVAFMLAVSADDTMLARRHSRRARRTASSPRDNASSTRVCNRHVSKQVPTITDTNSNSGQRTPQELPSSQNRTSHTQFERINYFSVWNKVSEAVFLSM